MGPRARSSIQPGKGSSTISARPVCAWVAADSRASDKLRRSADGVNSPRAETPNEERCCTPVVPRNGSGTASFTCVRRMDAPGQTVPRSRFGLRLERDLRDEAEAGWQSPSLQHLTERAFRMLPGGILWKFFRRLSQFSPSFLGACPTLTFLLRRTIRNHLRRSRPEIILNVFQRIHLRFFRACGLASGRTSFASSRRQWQTGS